MSPPAIDPGEDSLLADVAQEVLLELAADHPEDLELALQLFEELSVSKKPLIDLVKYKHKPVDVREFVESPVFMNKGGVVWPEVLNELEEINSGKYIEVVFTGGIGAAKTTAALYSLAYQLYLLSCLRNPHEEFGLDPSSEILTVFQSLSKHLARDVDYMRFRDMIGNAPYFEQRFPFNTQYESDMRFPNRIFVKPISGSDLGAIGQNVIGGLIDEMNFMAVVEKSKLSKDGEVYDQAVRNYNSIARRRESRFLQKGALPGLLCLVSSRNYPGQFTDKKEQEAKTNPRIYVYDKTVWQVKPAGSYSDERFKLFVGDATRKPRFLMDDDVVAEEDAHLVMEIPLELKGAFEADMLAAIRDIAGRSTYALHPFIMEPDKVRDCFGKGLSVFSRESCDFVASTVDIYPARFVNPTLPRFAHLDLALRGDSAGLAIGHVPKFVEIDRYDGQSEILPVIQYDGVLEIRAPRNGEILFHKIRALIYLLKKHGLNLRWVTMDTWQSTDTRQILAQRGYHTAHFSLDTDTRGYDVLKQAFYDLRVRAPKHDRAQSEATRLEINQVTRRVDHPPQGSKDCSDAMAGVAHGLTTRREIWAAHGVLAYMPERFRALVKSQEQERAA